MLNLSFTNINLICLKIKVCNVRIEISASQALFSLDFKLFSLTYLQY